MSRSPLKRPIPYVDPKLLRKIDSALARIDVGIGLKQECHQLHVADLRRKMQRGRLVPGIAYVDIGSLSQKRTNLCGIPLGYRRV